MPVYPAHLFPLIPQGQQDLLIRLAPQDPRCLPFQGLCAYLAFFVVSPECPLRPTNGYYLMASDSPRKTIQSFQHLRSWDEVRASYGDPKSGYHKQPPLLSPQAIHQVNVFPVAFGSSWTHGSGRCM